MQYEPLVSLLSATKNTEQPRTERTELYNRIFEMVDKTHTTETLRKTLFSTIDGLLEGTVSEKAASQVANLAEKIVKTADLEMRYSEHLDKLDRSETGISPGAMLLTQKRESDG